MPSVLVQTDPAVPGTRALRASAGEAEKKALNCPVPLAALAFLVTFAFSAGVSSLAVAPHTL